jgi:hypothetical protein
MRPARWIFLTAGILGLLSTSPLLWAEKAMVVTQPEFYYGFVCLNICWQVVYLCISSDPIRYRPMMIPAFLAKGSGTVALTWLYLLGRVTAPWVAVGAVDAVFAILFLIAYWATRHQSYRSRARLVEHGAAQQGDDAGEASA